MAKEDILKPEEKKQAKDTVNEIIERVLGKTLWEGGVYIADSLDVTLTVFQLKAIVDEVAKVKQEPVCPECKGTKKVEVDCGFEGFRIMPCHTCKGTGKHSRPSREKIEEWFAGHEFGDDLASLPKEHLEICGEYADQIIALSDEERKEVCHA